MFARSKTALARLVTLALAASASGHAVADVYVGSFDAPGRIDVFADDADGNVAPIRSIAGPATELGYSNAVGYDPARLELYVSDFQNQAIRVFDARASGDVAPLRSITSPGMGQPRDLVVDVEHQELIVITFLNFVTTYPLTANGETGGIRQIEREGAQNSQTRLSNPTGLALLESTDEILVGDYGPPSGAPASGEVLFYARTQSGLAAPVRDIRGPSADLGTYVASIAIDQSRDELYALVQTQLPGGGSAWHVAVFDALASGDTPPIRVIRGAAANLDFASAISFDPRTDRLLVSAGYGGGVPRVMAFPREANGNVAPLSVVAGGATKLDEPAGVLALTVPPEIFADGFE